MRDIHKSKYAQAIPGVNRIDDVLRLTSAEKCVDQFGDGLPMPERLLADAATAHQTGRQTKVWCENLNATGESAVREAFRRRDDKVAQWKTHLNKEIDNLAREIDALDEAERESGKGQQYATDVRRIARMTTDFRRGLPDKEQDDAIDQMTTEESKATYKVEEYAQQGSRNLKECRRKLENLRRALMSEAETKASTLNINRRCQHSEPLLSFRTCEPAPFNPNSEEDWERRLENMVRDATEAREEASKYRLQSSSTSKESSSEMEAARERTTRALQEEVARDERTQYNIRNTLEEVGREILWTKQRLASFLDDLRVQDKAKTLQVWRLNTLTCRPYEDRIRDAPTNKCEEEVFNVENREQFIAEGIDRNRALLGRLLDEKGRQNILLEKISRKLFIERENCLGLRRTIAKEK